MKNLAVPCFKAPVFEYSQQSEGSKKKKKNILRLVVEGNLDLTMFGNTYLLSKILLLVLNNIMRVMTLWLRIG